MYVFKAPNTTNMKISFIGKENYFCQHRHRHRGTVARWSNKSERYLIYTFIYTEFCERIECHRYCRIQKNLRFNGLMAHSYYSMLEILLQFIEIYVCAVKDRFWLIVFIDSKLSARQRNGYSLGNITVSNSLAEESKISAWICPQPVGLFLCCVC